MRWLAFGIALAVVLAQGCRDEAPSPPASERGLKFWHTFDTAQTEALNAILEDRARAGEDPVEVTLLPFARAMTILAEVLDAGDRCPDLVRIDATWLPGLADLGLLRPVPRRVLEGRRWLPAAEELARHEKSAYALPQALDGLALVHREGAFRGAALPWPPATLDELEIAASRLTSEDRHGLGLRADGYWYAAFLRAIGGRFPDPVSAAPGEEGAIDGPVAVEALDRMSALFRRGIAASPGAAGEQGRELARRFRDGGIAIVVEGPWLARELAGERGLSDLEVTPFPRGGSGAAAPRGAQLLAVPTCAGEPEAAWNLASDLTEPALQAAWGRRFGTVPATRAALDDSGRISNEFYRALQDAAPLPRHPVTAELFDDLTPAVRAVALGDATAEEALAGVRRGWGRLFERHGLKMAPADRDIDAGAEVP